MSDDPLLSLADAARYLCRHPQTLRQLARERAIGHIRQGRQGRIYFRRSALDRWLATLEVRALRSAGGTGA